jgi:hypothetical protein
VTTATATSSLGHRRFFPSALPPRLLLNQGCKSALDVIQTRIQTRTQTRTVFRLLVSHDLHDFLQPMLGYRYTHLLRRFLREVVDWKRSGQRKSRNESERSENPSSSLASFIPFPHPAGSLRGPSRPTIALSLAKRRKRILAPCAHRGTPSLEGCVRFREKVHAVLLRDRNRTIHDLSLPTASQ